MTDKVPPNHEHASATFTSKGLARADDLLEDERAFQETMRKAAGKADDLGDKLNQRAAEQEDKQAGSSSGGGKRRRPRTSKADSSGEGPYAHVHRFVEYIRLALSLLRDYRSGDYRSIDRAAVVLLMAAVAYFVVPTDLIFDFLGLPGYLDDAAVMTFVVSMVREELDQYEQWRQQQGG